MIESLTTDEQTHAARQGWMLAPIYDTRGYFCVAVLPTKTSSHTSAGAAFQFVWELAKQGDLVCRRALALVSSSEMAGKSKVAKTKKARK